MELETREPHQLINPEYVPGGRFCRADFSVAGDPFVEDAVDIYGGPAGWPVDFDRQDISLKYFLYILCKSDATPELLAQYPMLKSLFDHKDDVAFVERCRKGLRQLFQYLGNRVADLCLKYNLRLVQIAFTMPPQWDLDFEREYSRLLTDGFMATPLNDSFLVPGVMPRTRSLLEPDALAHHLVKDNIELIRFPHGRPPAQRRGKAAKRVEQYIVCIPDIGGHSIVSIHAFLPSLDLHRTAAANSPRPRASFWQTYASSTTRSRVSLA